VVWLREELQEGSQGQGWMGASPVLLVARGRTSLVIDGLHFRMSPSAVKYRTALAMMEVSLLRTTNCSFAIPLPHSSHHLGSLPAILWLENCVLLNTAAKVEDEMIRFLSGAGRDHSAMLCSVRNCLVNGSAIGHRVATSSAERKLWLSLHNNTFAGQIGNMSHTGALTTECWENLIVAQEAVFRFQDDSLWRSAVKLGDRNSLWIGARPLTEKERGDFTNSLLPGPALKLPPAFEAATPRDPLRAFRPKKTAVTAADGVNVGVRFDYLPDVPPES
jgi:hypothetical protein